MKNSEILMSHMRAYAADWDKADAEKKREIEGISNWKEDCMEYVEQREKIEKNFNATIAKTYGEHLNACIEVLSGAVNSLMAVCSDDAKDSFTVDIALIQAAQETLSEMEYAFYMEKHKNSYSCYRDILMIANNNQKLQGVHLTKPDTIKKYLDECMMLVSNFFNGYGQPVGDIGAKMVINKDEETGNEKNRICYVFREFIDPFLNGDFIALGREFVGNVQKMPEVLEGGSIYNLSTGQIIKQYQQKTPVVGLAHPGALESDYYTMR